MPSGCYQSLGSALKARSPCCPVRTRRSCRSMQTYKWCQVGLTVHSYYSVKFYHTRLCICVTTRHRRVHLWVYVKKNSSPRENKGWAAGITFHMGPVNHTQKGFGILIPFLAMPLPQCALNQRGKMGVATGWCPWAHASSRSQRSRGFSSILGEDQDLPPDSGRSIGCLKREKTSDEEKGKCHFKGW